MKIILLKDIPKVGKKYETKEISDGYALNMLIPKGLAVSATSEMVKKINLEKSKIEGEKKINQELLLKNLETLEGKTVTISEKANDKGHLFASVHIPEILKAIKNELRIDIPSESIVLDKPIKELGTHEITVKTDIKSIKFNLDIKSNK